MALHNDLGKKGEDLAENHLRKNGYRIIQRNWGAEKYEIDIIASDSEFIVFVEVKTRSSDQWGKPEDAVSKTKIKRIVEAADFYLKANDIEKPARFDIITVVINNKTIEIDHIEDAFWAPVN